MTFRSTLALTFSLAAMTAPTIAQPASDPPARVQPDARPGGGAPPADEAPARNRALRAFEMQADRLEFVVETDVARELLAEFRALPEIEERTIYALQSDPPQAITALQYDSLPDQARERLRPMKFDTTRYYQTIYGSPLVYVRPLDLVAKTAGWETLEGKRVLDFGYGQMGQVRAMAQAGADVVGTEVSSVVDSIYRYPGDQGQVTGSTGKTGSVALRLGRWPLDPALREVVGDGYDLFIARDVLRAGPMREDFTGRASVRVVLGVDASEFLASVNRVLNPGALAMVYNTGTVYPDIWEGPGRFGDIRSPFTRDQWESAGFELIALDEDDDETARTIAAAVGLGSAGENPLDLDDRYFARYTLARKVRDVEPAPAPDAPEGDADDEKPELNPWGVPIRKD